MGYRIVMEWNVDTDAVRVEVRKPGAGVDGTERLVEIASLPEQIPVPTSTLRVIDPLADDEP